MSIFRKREEYPTSQAIAAREVAESLAVRATRQAAKALVVNKGIERIRQRNNIAAAINQRGK